MMTQAYHEGGYFDPLYRSPYGSMHDHYYDRSQPSDEYGYPRRRGNRSEYPGRRHTRELIHEAQIGGPNGQSTRKRIGVAVSLSSRIQLYTALIEVVHSVPKAKD